MFYPTGLKPAGWLEYYARIFGTVEVNSTFYGLSKKSIFETWQEITPPGFQFTLKAPRLFTHMKRLIDPKENLAGFLQNAAGLTGKLAMFLFQLPKGWGFQPERLEILLAYMNEQQIIPGVLSALEIRDESWYNQECFEILRRFNTALVLADWPGFARDGPLTADFIYLRRHGPREVYASNYSDEMLAEDAKHIREWTALGSAVYVYFNNDIGGYAIKNAIRLKEMLDV